MANLNSLIKAGRWTYTPQEFDKMSGEAKKRGEVELRSKPLASAVRYDQPTGSVIIELNNGSTFAIPTRLMQGLRDASPRDLKHVEIMGPGLAIEWPTLDMQFTISGLLAGVFGTNAWLEKLGRRRGSARSSTNAHATRRNGRKRARRRNVQMTGSQPVS